MIILPRRKGLMSAMAMSRALFSIRNSEFGSR